MISLHAIYPIPRRIKTSNVGKSIGLSVVTFEPRLIQGEQVRLHKDRANAVRNHFIGISDDFLIASTLDAFIAAGSRRHQKQDA